MADVSGIVNQKQCSCGQGVNQAGIEKADGSLYEKKGPNWVVDDYGDHPELCTERTLPIEVELVEGKWKFRWSGGFRNGILYAADGSTILFKQKDPVPVIVNNAGLGQDTTVHEGIRTTRVSHNVFRVEVALDPTNPPAGVVVNSQGFLAAP